MTISGLTTDPPEWTLYKIDLSDDTTGVMVVTVAGILRPLDAKLYLKENDTGSGEMSFYLSDPQLALIGIGDFIGLAYRGAYRGGFLVESRELVDVNSSEYSGLVIKINGRGPLALLDDAIVYDWLTPDAENTRKFGQKNPMIPGGPSVPKGEIIWRLLDEAENYQTNPSGQHLKRYCWRAGRLGDAGDPATPPTGDPLITWDFTAVLDSLGVAWPDLEDMEFRVGNTTLLNVLLQIAAIRDVATPANWYDFTVTKEIPTSTTGMFVLHAYSGGIGSDLSDTIHFRVGMNCTEVSRKYDGAGVRNHVLVEFSEPSNPYTHVDAPAYALAYRRREGFLQASNASKVATAQNFGNAQLDLSKNTTKDIAVKVSDAVEPNLFIDYNLSDTIKYDNNSGVEAKHRIVGVQLSFTGDNQYADLVVEMD